MHLQVGNAATYLRNCWLCQSLLPYALTTDRQWQLFLNRLLLAAAHVSPLAHSYFIVAGLVFTPATVPYLRSEYGKEYDFDAPVSTA
jgi:hypothetical protein